MSDLNDLHGNVSTTKSNRVTGVVKFYSVQKCYGFIKRDDTKEYVFVHSKSVTGKNQRRVTRSLAKGEHVEFDVVVSDRSPEAIAVTGLNNSPVLGSEYALISMQWHQYNDYKRELLQHGEHAARDSSPRARRFFHRRTPRSYGNYNRNQQRNRKTNDTNKLESDAMQDQNTENENKMKSNGRQRRYNRNRRSKKQQSNDGNVAQNKIDNDANMTESNITTLLSELDIGNKMNSANSTSSESLDFEKINSDETTMAIGNLTSSASNRLAASFNKGNQ